MKNLKLFTIIVILSVIVSLSIKEVNSQSNQNIQKGFYIGPISHFFENTLLTDSHKKWYMDLFFNMMHSYCAHLDTIDNDYQSSGQKDGGFFEDTSNYGTEMNNVILTWKNIANDNSLIFEREKILRPAYGQRFTYQVEGVGTWHNRFPSYGYDSSDYDNGHDIVDNWMNETVTSKKCTAGIDSPGFMIKGLIENCGQTNNVKRVPNEQNSSGWERLYSDVKQQKYGMRWFIKPRMRIDSSFAKTHRTDTVVVVYIKRFDGKVIDSTAITCNNFLIMDNQGNAYYNGRYLERYFNFPVNDTANSLSVFADSLAIGRTEADTFVYQSKVDYLIKWLGKVDVWLDYVRVDDSWAHYLFTDTWTEGQIYPANNIWHFRERIKHEVLEFANTPGLGYFWVDEVQYPNLECIGEVNRLVGEYSQNKMSLLFITDPIAFMGWSGMRNQDATRQDYWDACIDKAIECWALNNIMVTQWFPLYYTKKYPDIFPPIPDSFYIKNYVFPAQNYNEYTYNTNYGVQNTFSWLVRQHKYYIQKAKDKGLIYGVINQINSDENNIKNGNVDWGIREPTNEEISLILNTSMAYGSKILLEFSYTSKLQDAVKNTYNWGLTSASPYLNKREYNYYGQLKWDYVAGLNEKLKQTGNYMYPMNNTDEHLIHDKTITVNTVTYDCGECGTANYDFICDIASLAPLINGQNPCAPTSNPSEYYDCPEDRFWELGFFKPNTASSYPNDKSKYIYAVNKRTYPDNYLNNQGDVRILKIKFNSSNLPGFNNWIIKEAVTDSVLTIFNKSCNDYITVARFEPGEGKLLKVAPVIQEGGTFVCDEDVAANQNFHCKDDVYTNGYNLKINNGVTIKFYNSKGIFIDNTQYLDIFAVELQGYNNENWTGLNITNSQNIIIQEATFKNIINGSKAVDIQNSTDDGIIFINSCNFYLGSSSITAGGIRAISLSEENILSPVYLYSNNFYCTNTNRAIEINPMGCDGCSCDIYNNNILSQSGNCITAIFLSNVNVAGIWDNTVSGFLYGIAGINSTLYLDNNEITSARSQAYGIFGASQSNLYLTDVGGYVAAGNNNISTTGIQGKNIKLTESNFDLDNGYNTLNITDYQNQEDKGFHIHGTIPDLGDLPPDTIFERKNCFKIDAQQTFNPAVYVVRNGSLLNCFYYLPFECQSPNLPIADEYVVSMPGGYNDTIKKYETNNQIPEAEQICHLMYKSLRLKNYDDVKFKSALLLTNYLNSIYAPDVISKLYLSSIKTDTNQTAVLQTKNFLEQLILNNPGKQELVKSSFYFIQKCKIYLEQYSSALTGLEEIINQNPYSYAGLIASWDYSATLLLMDTTLGSGGEKDNCITENLNISERNSDTLRTRKLTKFDSYDRSVFTKNDRNRLAAVIINTNNNFRERQTEKYREIEKEVKRGNTALKEEFEKMKNLKDVIKIKRPKSQPEFVDIVEKDINKVFENPSSFGNIKSLIEIPQNYSLSQNYPNPFNPITKISFTLPKESKVKLIIYDMLGREVAKIINNENLTAGTYIREFNGSNLSSGVYFLRILVNDGNDFTDVKKLLLLK
ncbi:MAG: T9SS type A sorting domain-containing protein [Ignavibacteria bacterium]|nr:T9SS type A sorting domain-containing protein [Ignavibacteria bacterium]